MKFLGKNFSIITLVTVILAFTPGKKEEQFSPVAVIELFTSQGCSSCPSAERLLTKTLAEAKQTGKSILALSFHVDYWNRLGWKDPFSDKKYSQRQNEYAQRFGLSSVYTPQAIVNGQREMTGSDKQKLRSAINASLGGKTLVQFKSIAVAIQADHSVKVNFSLEGNFTGCDINVALVSLHETTAVKRGENSGATLMNENIVRQFISVPATANGTIAFNISPAPADDNLAVVAYVQRRSDGKITGAMMANNF